MGQSFPQLCMLILALTQHVSSVIFARNNTSVFNESHASPNLALACAALRDSLSTDYAGQTDSTYKNLTEVNWSTTCWELPACIVSPKTTHEVAQAVQILAQHNATFAIRSGGHMANPGFSSIGQNGILLSLDSLTGLALSEDLSVLTVQPGNRWLAVYELLQPFNRTVIGGRVPTVGVGGLLLGGATGGLNYFTNEYGFAADSVVEFEVVLGDGSIVNATETCNSDLFRALKGGSSNFGIVTAYHLRTFELSEIYVEARLYSTQDTASVMALLAEYQREGQLDRKSSITTSFRPTESLLLFIYAGRQLQPSAFDVFYNSTIPFTFFAEGQLATVLLLEEIGQMGFNSTPSREYTRATSFKLNTELYQKAYNIYLEELANAPADATVEFVPQPISRSMIEYGDQFGGNTMGLANEPQLWLDIVAEWQDPSHDQAVIELTTRIEDRIASEAKSCDLYLPFVFMNDAAGDQDVINGYGAENVRKLKAVSARYDPAQVFQRLQNNGFKL